MIQHEHRDSPSRIEATLLEFATVDDVNNILDSDTSLRDVCGHHDLPHPHRRPHERPLLVLGCDRGVQRDDDVLVLLEAAHQ